MPRRAEAVAKRFRQSERRGVEDPVVRLAQVLGIPHRKMNGAGRRDWPDRMFFVDGGRPLIVEFKRKGKVATYKQSLVLEELRDRGYDVHLVDNAADGKRLLHDRATATRRRIPAVVTRPKR